MIQTKDVSQETLNLVVKLHKDHYPDNHATKFWPKKLLHRYMEIFSESDNTIICITSDNKILGYAIYGCNIELTINTFARENLLQIILFYLSSPHFAIKLMSARIRSTVRRLRTTTHNSKDWILLSICTDRSDPNIAKTLIEKFEKDGSKKGFNICKLFVKKSNDVAIKFYLKHGYNILSIIDSETCIMAKSI